MKNLKKLMIAASLSITAQQSIVADSDAIDYSYTSETTSPKKMSTAEERQQYRKEERQQNRKDRKEERKSRRRDEDHIKPKHQGFGRIGTAIENTVTLHPGNAVNSLATGDQADTTFGYHTDDEGRVKANHAHTKHNRNKDYYSHEVSSKKVTQDTNGNETESSYKTKQSEDANIKKSKTTGHWFWKKNK